MALRQGCVAPPRASETRLCDPDLTACADEYRRSAATPFVELTVFVRAACVAVRKCRDGFAALTIDVVEWDTSVVCRNVHCAGQGQSKCRSSRTTYARDDTTRPSLRELAGRGRRATLQSWSGPLDELPDLCEVVVIVLCDKVQVIDQAHGLLKARMRHGVRVKSWLELRQAIDQG